MPPVGVSESPRFRPELEERERERERGEETATLRSCQSQPAHQKSIKIIRRRGRRRRRRRRR